MMSLLGLERISPVRRSRRSNTGARSYFTPAEWKEIEAAIARGLTFSQIHRATQRYSSEVSLFNAYKARKRAFASNMDDGEAGEKKSGTGAP